MTTTMVVLALIWSALISVPICFEFHYANGLCFVAQSVSYQIDFFVKGILFQ